MDVAAAKSSSIRSMMSLTTNHLGVGNFGGRGASSYRGMGMLNDSYVSCSHLSVQCVSATTHWCPAYLAGEYMYCSLCGGTFIAWDQHMLDQLSDGQRSKFPAVLTRKYAEVVSFLRVHAHWTTALQHWPRTFISWTPMSGC